MYRCVVAALAAVALAGSALTGCDAATAPTSSPAAGGSGSVSVIAKGLRIPWGMAFLPDGTALVTERDSGRVLSVTPGGQVQEVYRLPRWPTPDGSIGVRAGAEVGLLGIAVPPTYTTDRWVYLYYTSFASQPKVSSDNRIVRFRIGQTDLEPILTGIPAGDFHGGGRIAFGPDGMLYITTGETFYTRSIAQDTDSLGGKILRVTPEGKPAPGNPFPDSPVWSIGHRNVQGIAWDRRGRLYATEFGQDDYDELNLIEPGRNYGWPLVEGAGSDPRFTNPITTWTPTGIASPSGMAVIDDWIYVACLAGQVLYRVSLDGRTTEPLFKGTYGRLRTATAAPDGSLWLTTSNHDGRGRPGPDDDKILRLIP